jgi:CheY-like chemotaxis protein
MADTRLILVVEDNPDTRAMLVDALVGDGNEVLQAADGRAALALAVDRAPGLIVLDMRLPVMDGWQFATAYRALPGPHAPLLVLTAASDAASWAADVDAAAFLSKPFDVDRLRLLVHHLCPTGDDRDAASNVEGMTQAAAPVVGDLAALLAERQELIERIAAAEREPKDLVERLEHNRTHGDALLSQLTALIRPDAARA